MTRIWITGASGMVGRNLVDRLGGAHDLVTPDRAALDLRDGAAVRRFVREARPDAVVHCAGTVGGIQANLREPVRFLVENLEVGTNVVMAAAEAGVPRLLNLGSSCMYPRAAPNPLREESLLQGELEPTNEGYALAKIAVQRMCAYLARERPELIFRTILPCNLYGRWDRFAPERSHLVAAILCKVHEAVRVGSAEVEVWGSGRARREFMYAGDLADFIAVALDRLDELPEVLNVGTGIDHTVDEYYAAVAGVIGYRGALRHDLERPEGMARKLLDVSRLAALGWRATTTLEDGLRQTYQHFLATEAAR